MPDGGQLKHCFTMGTIDINLIINYTYRGLIQQGMT
jgi:hypothetical protein